jgi:hypothetical protein
LKAKDGRISSFSWILLYRASISGYDAADFHQACDGMGKCLVVVKAENGRIAAAYNEDGFYSDGSDSPNINGFIVSVADDGGCGEIFHRNAQEVGIVNYYWSGPVFGNGNFADVVIVNNCHRNERCSSRLGTSCGRKGPGVDDKTLFDQAWFRVADYEAKIVIE